MVIPGPKVTSLRCLRATGEEGLGHLGTQQQVQGGSLGCPLCKALSISSLAPAIPRTGCNALPVWWKGLRVWAQRGLDNGAVPGASLTSCHTPVPCIPLLPGKSPHSIGSRTGHVHTHTHTDRYMCICAYMHTKTYTHTTAHTHIGIHPTTHVPLDTHAHTCMPTHVHA